MRAMGVPTRPTSKPKHALLPTDDRKSGANAHHQGSHKQSCVKLTQYKVISIAIVLLVTTLTLVYICASPNSNITLTDAFVPTELAPTESTTEDIDRERFENNRIRYKHTKRRLPNCLIIGIRKAGTRALLTFLDLHPQIRTAKNEVHFFDDEENYAEGYEWYRKKMPYTFPDQVTMEKSPAYFACNEAPERVHKMNPSMKLLLVVRDPVERAVSDYLQIHLNKVQKNKPDLTFEEHVITENGDIDRTFNPIKRSLYFRFMRNWLRYFPLDQFLLISGENLVKNPIHELRRVEKFLSLDHRIMDENFYFNETRGFFCVRNETGEKCLAESKGRPHPYVDPLVVQKLREFFRPYNQQFYAMVKKDFGWA